MAKKKTQSKAEVKTPKKKTTRAKKSVAAKKPKRLKFTLKPVMLDKPLAPPTATPTKQLRLADIKPTLPYSETKPNKAQNGEVDVECHQCGEEIPAERLKVVNTNTCVVCMEEMETLQRRGFSNIGTQRHRMEFETEGFDEVESITMHINRRE